MESSDFSHVYSWATYIRICIACKPEESMCGSRSCTMTPAAAPPRQAADSLAAQAAQAFDQQRFDDAIALFTEAIACCSPPVPGSAGVDLPPLVARLLCNRAAAYTEAGRAQQAGADASAAIDLAPSWHKPYIRLAMALVAQPGRRAEAVDVLHRGILACAGELRQQELKEALDAVQQASRHGKRIKVVHTATDAGRELRQQDGQQHVTHVVVEPTVPPPAASTCGEQQQGESSAPAAVRSSLPVTIICGFLGAGKTTLVRHILGCISQPPLSDTLASSGGSHFPRVGLIVNDLAGINVDAELLGGAVAVEEHWEAAAAAVAGAERGAEGVGPLEQQGSQSLRAAANLLHSLPKPIERPMVELSNGCIWWVGCDWGWGL